MSLSWRQRCGIVLPTSTFLDNLVLDHPKKETTGSSGFYQSCDPTAEEETTLTSLPLQGHESCEQQPLQAELIRPWSVVTTSLLPCSRTCRPWKQGTLLPEPVHHSHVPLCCLSSCVAAPCPCSSLSDVLQWGSHQCCCIYRQCSLFTANLSFDYGRWG